MTEEFEEQEKTCGCKKGLLVTSIVLNSIATLSLTVILAVLIFGVIIPGGNFEFGLPKIKQADNNAPKEIFKGKTISHQDAMNDDKIAVVLFYADWCPHCRNFAPTFQKLSKDRKLKKKYNFVRINSESNDARPLMEEYDIQGFPTLVLVNPQTGEKYPVSNSLLFTENAKEGLAEIIETFAEKGLDSEQK